MVEHALFDQLVRLEEQSLRDREFECLRGLEVDHQLELGGLLDRYAMLLVSAAQSRRPVKRRSIRKRLMKSR